MVMGSLLNDVGSAITKSANKAAAAIESRCPTGQHWDDFLQTCMADAVPASNPPTQVNVQDTARQVADTVKGTTQGVFGLAEQAGANIANPNVTDFTEGTGAQGTLRGDLLQQRQGQSFNPIADITNPLGEAVSAAEKPVTSAIRSVTRPAIEGLGETFGAIGGSLTPRPSVTGGIAPGGPGEQVGEAFGRGLGEVVLPDSAFGALLEATPIGFAGDINALRKAGKLDDLPFGAAESLVRGTGVDQGTDAARVLTGSGAGRALPEGAAFNPGIAGAGDEGSIADRARRLAGTTNDPEMGTHILSDGTFVKRIAGEAGAFQHTDLLGALKTTNYEMMENGLVRMMFNGRELDINFLVRPTPEQVRAIKRAAAQAKDIYIDAAGRSERLGGMVRPTNSEISSVIDVLVAAAPPPALPAGITDEAVSASRAATPPPGRAAGATDAPNATLGTPPAAPAAPSYYHETSPERGLAWLQEGTVPRSGPMGQGRVFMADAPDLALGQGTNKGVVLEFDATKVNARPHSKPGQSAQFADEVGSEFVSESAQPGAVRSMTIKSDADLTPEFERSLERNVRYGNIKIVDNADGSRTVTSLDPYGSRAALPRGALPGASMEDQLAASLKLGKQGIEDAKAAANPRVSVADMKKALDDVGQNSTGTNAEIASRYRQMKSAEIGGIGTPGENTSNAARQAYGEVLEATGDPESARLAARKAAAREATSNSRAASMDALMDALMDAFKRGEQGSLTLGTLPKAGKLSDELTALIGLPRTLKASFDLSAPGRQGLALAFRHPKEWVESWKPMMQAWKSEEGMNLVNGKIDSMMSQWRAKYGDDVVHAYQTGGGAEGLERVPGFEPAGEGLVSGLTRNVPGLEKSERSYATFLNYQKAKTFDTMASALERAGETDPAAYKRLGNIIDHATGYGAAPLKGRFEGQALFSQRYMSSRLQFLTDPIVEGLIKGDLNAARAATENLVAFMGGMAGLAFLINESGLADVNLDPRSSDFGKIRIGPQRFDFGAGFLPVLRTAGRVATGQAKSSGGSVYDIDEKTELLKFFRNKLAPIPSEIVTRIVGEDPVGEKPSDPLSLDFARQMFMPLIADAVLETFEETGDPARAALAAGSELFGGGASAYGSGQSVQRSIAQERFGAEFDTLNSQQQAEINAEIAESDVELEWRERQSVWWQAREDAFEYWKSDLDPDSAAHPIVAHVLEQDSLAGVFPGPDSDGELAKWIQDTYEVSRQEGVDYANALKRQTGLDDLMERYRYQITTTDTGFAQAWIDAYENEETDDGPPKWIRDLVEETAGAR